MARNAAPFLLLTLILLLPGCGGGGYTRSPVVTPQQLSCTGNKPAQITLYSPSEARLTFEDKSYDLNRIETASGVKYENGDISFWNKGIDALITRDDGSMSTCVMIPKAGL